MIYAYLLSDQHNASLDVAVRLKCCEHAPSLVSSAFPNLHNLLLTNHQISTETRAYFFAFFCFCFVDCDHGYLSLITHFWQKIGPVNLALVRRISLPLYNIGLFGNVDCMMGRSRLWCASSMLARFTALTRLDLGICLVECLPPTHGLFGDADMVNEEELEAWDWGGLGTKSPIWACFEALGRFLGKTDVEVGVYWSDLLTLELLPGHSYGVFAMLESVYKARLLVALQQWLKVKKPVRSRGPLEDFQRLYDRDFGGFILPDAG
jgi:hypothetical protein